MKYANSVLQYELKQLQDCSTHPAYKENPNLSQNIQKNIKDLKQAITLILSGMEDN